MALVLSLHAHATDEAVILKSGDVIGGKIVSLDATNLVMDIKRGGKTERVTIAVKDLTSGSHYTVRAARVPDGDAAAHMALGEWCLANDLAYFAMRQFAKAKQADASMAAMADEGTRKAKLARGRHFYTRAVNAMQAKDYAEARRLFGIVIKHYPTPFGSSAKKAMDFVDQQIAARAKAAPSPRPVNVQPGKKGGAAMGGGQQSGVSAGTQRVLNRLARQIRGLSQAGYFAKTDSKARRAWRDASVVVDQALTLLDRQLHAGKIDTTTHGRVRQPFVRQGTDLALQLAVISLRRDNEYTAQRWLARVLLLDPDNERAHELRTYIVTEFRDRNRRRPGKPFLR